jgi:hypothetical protein
MRPADFRGRLRAMKDTVSRVGRITKYVVVPEELITPVSQVAAGAVVKVTRVVSKGPVTRQTARVRSGVAQLRITRLSVRRGSPPKHAAAEPGPGPGGTEPAESPEPASLPPVPGASD